MKLGKIVERRDQVLITFSFRHLLELQLFHQMLIDERSFLRLRPILVFSPLKYVPQRLGRWTEPQLPCSLSCPAQLIRSFDVAKLLETAINHCVKLAFQSN